MNILCLVFSILLILSFGFYMSLEKGSLVRRLDQTFIGQANASRNILSQYENETYKQLRSVKKNKEGTKPKTERKKKQNPNPPKLPKINPECARLNLWPLLQEGREEHQLLYERAAMLLRTFYQEPLFSSFSEKKGLEYRFLDTWLASLKEALLAKPDEPAILEKIALKDPSLQMLYYRMLRGAKEKYPTLLDFVKITPNSQDRVCLHHATPQFISVFFGSAAQAVYDELHNTDRILITEEMIEEICRSHRFTLLNKDLFTLVDLSRPKHKNSLEKTLFEEDPATQISLRKKVYLQKSS